MAADGGHRWRLSIRVALALALGGFTVITASVIGLVFYVAAVDTARDLARKAGQAEVGRIGATVDAQFQPAADQARFLADYIGRGRVSPRDDERLRDLLLGSVGAVRQLAGVGFLRPNLRMVWATAVSEGHSYVTEIVDLSANAEVAALMREAQKTRTSFWVGPLRMARPAPLLIAITPVVGENGRFMGAVAAAVSLRTASIRLAALADEERAPFVVTEDGRIVMHAELKIDDSAAAEDTALPTIASGFDPVLAALAWPPRDLQYGNALPPRGAGVAEARVGGTDYYVVFRRIDGYGAGAWYLGYHVPQSWLQALLATINSAIAFAAILLAVALLLALWLGRAIANPIRALANNARRIAGLDLDTPPIAGSRLTEIDMAAEAQGAMRNGLLWLRNYIPRSLAPVLMQSGDAIVSAERDIVVLFTDIVGFSGIAEGRPADQLAGMLNRHFALLGAAIEAEGGTIDKYIGDSVMAFWGAPLDQQDRAARAVRAAIAIARSLHADNARRARKGFKPIRIRIGLHQGPALVGNIGAPGRINYTLIGDTVNIAQRLEQFGREVDDGGADAVIVISAELARALPEEIPCVDLGAHLLPGRSAPMHLLQIKAV